jgi:hypothetical protein
MTAEYGLSAANNTPKLAQAQVTRWNDRVRRHTLYTVCGTAQDGWGLYNDPGVEGRAFLLELARNVTGNPALTLELTDGDPLPDWGASPDAAVARAANPALFNWVPVSYPASSPATAASLENNWQPSNLSIADSINVGVAELTSLIKATPGTFALVGMSQGAIVTSQVLKALLPGGNLAHRYNDCIAGVAIGNPCRKAGSSFPGGTPAEGAGLMANVTIGSLSGLEKTTLPSWWWELSTPGDFFSTAPTNTVGGPLLTSVAQSVGTYRGGGELNATMVGAMIAAFLSGAVPLVTAALQSAISALFRPQAPNALGIIVSWLTTQFAYLANPHILYGVLPPPALPTGLAGVSPSSTYVEVATAYLNARGAAVAPR